MSQPPPLPVPQGTPPKPPQYNVTFFIEVAFLVMISMNLLLLGKAIDINHSRNAALFHSAMMLIGVLGLIVSFIVKRVRASNAPPEIVPVVPSQQGAVNSWDQAATWQGIVVSYTMTRKSALRQEIVNLRRTPNVLSILFVPIFFTFITVSTNWDKLNASALTGKATSSFFGMTALIACLFVLTFLVRFPKSDSERRCVTSLNRDGIQDVTPDKTNLIPWSAIGKVVEQDGDLFFYPTPGNTANCTIPREAFESREAAQRFFQAARTLWETKGAAMPSEATLREFGPRVAETSTSVASPSAVVPMPGFDLSAD